MHLPLGGAGTQAWQLPCSYGATCPSCEGCFPVGGGTVLILEVGQHSHAVNKAGTRTHTQQLGDLGDAGEMDLLFKSPSIVPD